MLEETIEYLTTSVLMGFMLDGTLGGGGHAYHVCEKLSERGRYIGIDQDRAAIASCFTAAAPLLRTG